MLLCGYSTCYYYQDRVEDLRCKKLVQLNYSWYVLLCLKWSTGTASKFSVCLDLQDTGTPQVNTATQHRTHVYATAIRMHGLCILHHARLWRQLLQHQNAQWLHNDYSVIYFSYTPQNLLLLCAWTATTTHYAHGRQRRCQEDPVGLPFGRLEKTTGSSLHHMAQHHPTGSETLPSYAPRSSRFGSEPPSVEDDVDVWRYAIASCMPETMTTTTESHLNSRAAGRCHS